MMDRIMPEDATEIADQIERQGPEHDRSVPGRGLPDNCIAVFRGGNITNYLPILDQGGKKQEGHKKGDVVRLRSGGPMMTIVRDFALQNMYECVYVDSKNKIRKANIHKAALMKS